MYTKSSWHGSLLYCVLLMATRLQVINSHLAQNMRPPITTHVLDTSKGLPAANVSVSLYLLTNGNWTLMKESLTNSDGRCNDLTLPGSVTLGRYKLHFETETYFSTQNISTFFPFVEIVFDIRSSQEHYHVPLLLTPYGYSTYRGS